MNLMCYLRISKITKIQWQKIEAILPRDGFLCGGDRIHYEEVDDEECFRFLHSFCPNVFPNGCWDYNPAISEGFALECEKPVFEKSSATSTKEESLPSWGLRITTGHVSLDEECMEALSKRFPSALLAFVTIGRVIASALGDRL